MHQTPSQILGIVDFETLGRDAVTRGVEAARGGVRWLCLRARTAAPAERVGLAHELLTACPGAFLTVHGDVDACRKTGAPGLHLPSKRDWGEVRRANPDLLLGVSCHGAEELEQAACCGADYALLSPVFAPASKPLYGPALGVEEFRRLVAGARLPVLALGGVHPRDLPGLARAGAVGAALLGSLFLAPDVAARAREYVLAAQTAFAGRKPAQGEELT
jgi:thiamine-phosphate pyrophosphorylase